MRDLLQTSKSIRDLIQLNKDVFEANHQDVFQEFFACFFLNFCQPEGDYYYSYC